MSTQKNQKKWYNITIDCLERQAIERPNQLAVTFVPSNSSYTFSEMNHLVSAYAYQLKQKGISKTSRALIQLPNSLGFMIAFLGCIKADLIPIPVSHLLTPTEIDFLKRDSGAKLVIQKLLIKKKNASSTETKPTRADTPAYWLYTSGTTGKPKAVIHAHRSIRAHDTRVKLWQNLKEDDVVFNTSKLNWSYALTAGWLDIWRFGQKVIVAEHDLTAEEILKVIREQKVSIFMSVPGIYRKITEHLKNKTQTFPCLRVCLSAGEKLPEEIRKKFLQKTHLEIFEGLGMTEHSVYLIQPYGKKRIAKSCGQAVPGQKIAILKTNLAPVKAGEVGILASHRSCEGLALGYHHRPEEEKKVFRKNWFLSGDAAFKDKKGNIFFQGRSDDLITAGGYRISPLEVEQALNQCTAISESAVIGQEISPGKTIICAFVVCQPSKVYLQQKNEEELSKKVLKNLSKTLAPYKLPRKMIWCKSLPKTPNGKIKRAVLSTDEKKDPDSRRRTIHC